jgi:F-type H+-transporting ATPase subunit b
VVDWPTLIAQIVNFLILVWLLKRFLYGPIIRAMDQREEKIASRLKDAKAKQENAESEAEAFRKKTQELDAQREQLLAQAKQDADAHRKELMQKAREEVDALQARWRDVVAHQKRAFLQDLRQRAAQQTLAVARRALGDLAGADLEARIVEAFLARLEALPDDEWAALARPSTDEDEERVVVVRSAFELPDAARQRLQGIVRSHVGDDAQIRHETSFDLIAGIELRGQGRRIAWSLASYLDALEEAAAEAFEEQPQAEALQQEVERDIQRDEKEQAAEAAEEQHKKEREAAETEGEKPSDKPKPQPDVAEQPPAEKEQGDEAEPKPEPQKGDEAKRDLE